LDKPVVKRVVIAGGGTAGWLAAAALVKQLGGLLDITLVESDEIGTVGVGESTIPTTRAFHTLIGVDEQAFMRATGSSFKLGIRFEHWGAIGDRYIHSFGTMGKSTWMADFHHFWLEGRARSVASELGDYCFELQAARASKFATGPDAQISYAYHLDAVRYARFLRESCEPAGVRRIEGMICEVRQHPETGFIEALMLDSGEVVEGDLFLDCTGFRALLIEQTLETGYDDWSHWLPTDSAYVVQTKGTGPAVPYTKAIAREAGWRWEIPLQHRMGNGFVFSSAHMENDTARAQLLRDIKGEPLFDPRLIRYRTGGRRQVWNKNCIALGLASGFIEPLESTSIHLVKIAVTRLLKSFPFNGFDDALIDRFNHLSRRELEGVRDFIILHYHLTERDDSAFWRQCRTMDIPDSLAQRIALFRENAQAYQDSDELFRVDSWVQVMLGQRVRPQGYHHLARMMPPGKLQLALADIKANIAGAVAKMPAHQEFLDRYCASAAPDG
jgi:tryptophan halogenase